MITWPPGGCSRVAFKTKRRQIELVDKQIDNANKLTFSTQSSNLSGKSVV